MIPEDPADEVYFRSVSTSRPRDLSEQDRRYICDLLGLDPEQPFAVVQGEDPVSAALVRSIVEGTARVYSPPEQE